MSERSARTDERMVERVSVFLVFLPHSASIGPPARLFVRSFARIAHSSAGFAILALLARSAALICSLARSLTPELVGKLFFL